MPPSTPFTSNIKWKTISGLVIIAVATASGWDWIWGLLFLFWLSLDLKNGVAYFLEPVPRSTNPILFWIIIATWFAFAVVTIGGYFRPDIFYPQYY